MAATIQKPRKTVSRQRRSQMRAQAAGLCVKECGRPISEHGGTRCDVCRVKTAIRLREKRGHGAWNAGGKGRPPLGKRAEMLALRASGLAKLTEIERYALCLMPKPERRAIRASALAKLTHAERGVLRLNRMVP